VHAVLFGELIGASDLYTEAGADAAHDAVTSSAERIAQAAASRGARLIKTLGARIMLVAPSAGQGAAAACAMQAAAVDLPAKLALGVGMHCGPVIEEHGDVFGDAVNLAARLVEQAARGQILLAGETAAALGGLYRYSIRRLYSIAVKGRSGNVPLCELIWRSDANITVTPYLMASAPRAQLTLKYRGREIVLRDSGEALSIGRGDDSGLVLADTQASRHHCSIQERNGHFVLVDRSTNGTFVTVAGEREVLVAHDEFTLRKRGWISFGSSRDEGDEAAEFTCD
jgi:adenylate cyclase